ncbi:MAG: hypothetical protein OXC63_00670 [Aestuariivita sp.]|nr:hypothetical protein [Aestuariivita sp.]MCY4345874.1 hypothetical protein [Aestuariivita sp.]
MNLANRSQHIRMPLGGGRTAAVLVAGRGKGAKRPGSAGGCPSRSGAGCRQKGLTITGTDDIRSGMNKLAESDQSKSLPTGLSDEERTLGGFLWAVFDLHLRQTQRRLSTPARLAIALMGSLALFSVLLFTGSLNDIQPESGLAGGTLFRDPA